MEEARAKVDECVKQYIKNNPAEWEAFKDWSHEQRKQKKDKFAVVSKDSAHLIQRKLGEIPEMLHNMIHQALTEDEWQWFNADGPYRGDFKGPYWFYKKYPVFAITEV